MVSLEVITYANKYYYEIKDLLPYVYPKKRSAKDYIDDFGVPGSVVINMRPIDKNGNPCKNNITNCVEYLYLGKKYQKNTDIKAILCKYYHSDEHQNKHNQKRTIELVNPGKCNEENSDTLGQESTEPKVLTTSKVYPILDLKEHELFKDLTGNVWDIEVRGERKEDNIFFSVADVSKYLASKSLQKILLDDRSAYEKDRHYVDIIINKKKHLFLTYLGLIKVASNSKSANGNLYADWVKSNMYTIQFGTDEEKKQLAVRLTGISLISAADYFSLHAGIVSGLYLIKLGTVKALRKLLNIPAHIPDSSIVYKYGRSKDIVKRCSQHVNNYKASEGYEPVLVKYCLIDRTSVVPAETEFKHNLVDMGFKLDVKGATKRNGKTELAVFGSDNVHSIGCIMQSLGEKHSRSNKELQRALVSKDEHIKTAESKAAFIVEKTINGCNTSLHKKDMAMKDQQILHEQEMFKKDKEAFAKDATIREQQHTIDSQAVTIKKLQKQLAKKKQDK